MRSSSVSKITWSGKRALLLSESVFLKMLIVRERKAAQRKIPATNAIYFQKEIYREFHHLYEEPRNISRGPHPIITVVIHISKNASTFHFLTNYKFRNVSVIAMKCKTHSFTVTQPSLNCTSRSNSGELKRCER
jgi:hypothetical protein